MVTTAVQADAGPSAKGASQGRELLSRERKKLIGEDGTLDSTTEALGKVGVFAIFDDDDELAYVGISRDVATSLRKCLARRPRECTSFCAEYVARPSRVALEELRTSWISEWETQTGRAIRGCDGGDEQKQWESAIDVLGKFVQLTAAEKEAIENAHGADRAKELKKTTRRFQAEIEEILQNRGMTEKLKFASKLKNDGLLDVESVKIKTPDSIGASTRRVETD